MKITLILGSPRPQSVGAQLARGVLGAFEDRKPRVTQFVLNDLSLKGCQGCGSCKGKTESCVVKDDLAKALGHVADSDLVVATSPIYMGGVAAQLKAFIDRSYCWYKPDFYVNHQPSRLAPGKKFFLIATQGEPREDAYLGEIEKYLAYFRSHGFKTGHFVASGMSPAGSTEVAPEILAKAMEEIARL